MIWLILAFLSHVVFIPGLYDGFSLPKRIYALGLGIAAIVYLFSHARNLPLFPFFSVYVGLSLVPLFWLVNIPLFVERFALELSGVAIFWAVANSEIKREQVQAALLFACAVTVIVIAAEQFFPFTHGTMGNPKYSAFIAAQAAPLALALLPGVAPIIGGFSLAVFSMPSRAAFAAAFISLFVFILCKNRKRNIFFYVFFAALLTTAALPIATKQFELDINRKPLWANATTMLKLNHPFFFGIGRGQFEVLYPKYANSKQTDRGQGGYLQHLGAVKANKIGNEIGIASFTYHHAHNEFLNIGIETGVISLGLLWAILIQVGGVLQQRNTARLAIGCSIIATILFSTFWFPFSHPSMAITFWALLGLLWNQSKR